VRLQLDDSVHRHDYRFASGQFNMLGLFGVGEVAISIVSDPAEPELIGHTIRSARRDQRPRAAEPGDSVGVRGHSGAAGRWRRIVGRNVLVVTGGLGCTPSSA